MTKSISIASLFLCLTLFGFTILEEGNSTDSDKKIIIENAELIIAVESQAGFDFFEEAVYEAIKGDIKFKTQEKVEKITIYQNDEKLVYVLPVKTKKIIIGKSLFDKGNYNLVFKLADAELQYTAEVEVL